MAIENNNMVSASFNQFKGSNPGVNLPKVIILIKRATNRKIMAIPIKTIAIPLIPDLLLYLMNKSLAIGYPHFLRRL